MAEDSDIAYNSDSRKSPFFSKRQRDQRGTLRVTRYCVACALAFLSAQDDVYQTSLVKSRFSLISRLWQNSLVSMIRFPFLLLLNVFLVQKKRFLLMAEDALTQERKMKRRLLSSETLFSGEEASKGLRKTPDSYSGFFVELVSGL